MHTESQPIYALSTGPWASPAALPVQGEAWRPQKQLWEAGPGLACRQLPHTMGRRMVSTSMGPRSGSSTLHSEEQRDQKCHAGLLLLWPWPPALPVCRWTLHESLVGALATHAGEHGRVSSCPAPFWAVSWGSLAGMQAGAAIRRQHCLNHPRLPRPQFPGSLLSASALLACIQTLKLLSKWACSGRPCPLCSGCCLQGGQLHPQAWP